MSGTQSPSSLTLPKVLALLALAVVATGAVVYLAIRPRQPDREAVVSVMDAREAEQANVNVSQAGTPSEKVELGRRYRVRIEGESREGTEGIAKIGGMIVFVKNSRPGDEVLVEITRMRRTTAEGVVVADPSAPAGAARAPVSASIPVGQVFTGVVTDAGRYGDGVVRVAGRTVYVADATMGQHVVFEVTEHRERYDKGRIVEVLGGGAAAASASAPSFGPVGQVFTGTVTDIGRFGDGIVRVNNRPVYVHGAQKDQVVVFEITERLERHDKARLLTADGKPAEVSADASAPREAIKAPHIQVGYEGEVEIVEKERRNPDKAGVGRIDGLAILVDGAQPGDKVRVRVTERQPRFARAEIVEKAAPAPAN